MPPATPDAPGSDPGATDPIYDALVWRRNLFAGVAAFCFALVIITGALDVFTSVDEDRSFSVTASPRVVIRDAVGGGLRGGVMVQAGAPDRVRVEGKVHGTWRVRYVLEQRGDDIVIDAQPRPLLGWLGFLGPVRFSVTAPAASRLDIDTQAARIEVQGITGGGALRTTNGEIRLAGAGGPLTAVTTNGPINADGFSGSAEFRATNGSLEVHDGHGTFDVTTTNGAVTLDTELRSGAHHRAVTTNGAINVRLRGEPSLRIEASTTNGAVVVNRANAVGKHSSHSFSGAIGGGEGELLLRTTNGAITIE